MKIWDLIKSLVHAAEEQFTDPKSGPVKIAWVKAQISNALDNVKMSGWLRDICNALVGALIEAAVKVMKEND